MRLTIKSTADALAVYLVNSCNPLSAKPATISITYRDFVKPRPLDKHCVPRSISRYQPAVYPGYQNPPGQSQPIGRAKNTTSPSIQNMDVDHRRTQMYPNLWKDYNYKSSPKVTGCNLPGGNDPFLEPRRSTASRRTVRASWRRRASSGERFHAATPPTHSSCFDFQS